MFLINKSKNMILGNIADKIEQSDKNFYITNTSFLDLNERSLFANSKIENQSISTEFWGGYIDPERCILINYPKSLYESLEEVISIQNPLSVLRVTKDKNTRELTHRDFLGSLLSLGIKRQLIGDILVSNNSTDIIVLSEIVEFLLANYTKAANLNLTVKEVPIDELSIPDQKYEIFRETVPSLRLDNIVSSGFKISRTNSIQFIKSGQVFVDNIEIKKIDFQVKVNSRIILRKHGKIIFSEIAGKSKKERIWIEIKKYL